MEAVCNKARCLISARLLSLPVSVLSGATALILLAVLKRPCRGLIKLLSAGLCPISAGCYSKQNVILESFIKVTLLVVSVEFVCWEGFKEQCTGKME